MKPEEKEYYIEVLDEIIDAVQHKISKKELIKLVKLREKIRAAHERKNILEAMGTLLSIFKKH